MMQRNFFYKKICWLSLLAAILINLSAYPRLVSGIADANAGISCKQEFANKQALINVGELNDLANKEPVKIIDVRPSEQYRQEHLPGAVNISWRDYSNEQGLIPTPEMFAALLSNMGINNNDTIILYAGVDKHDPAYTAHFWWLLDMFGYNKVKTLDGGLKAWQAAGYRLTSEIPRVCQGSFLIKAVDTAKLATTEDVMAVVKSHDPKTIILDVREKTEFIGEVQAPGAASKGRIPGAVWLYWEDVLNTDKTIKDVGELQNLFTEKGIAPDSAVIIYCQAGVRAAHTVFVLSELLGYKHVKNYAGSWSEWSQRDDLPLEIGGNR